jgi:raffinose/stachyose/melibiose transport system substrate-binding protein
LRVAGSSSFPQLINMVVGNFPVLMPAFSNVGAAAQSPFPTIYGKPVLEAEYCQTLGTAGDIITCRPFDASLELFNKGHLASLNDLPSMAGFSDVAKSAWTTDDGKTTFCVPMASVIHGFIYNKDIFAELKLTEPKTEEEFLAVLDAIKKDGKYVPLVLGTNDQWEAATMGFQNIGPNYWKGEEGRKKLIDGTGKLTDPEYVNTFAALAKWSPYMGDGYKAQTYPDSQNLFGLGAVPLCSWLVGHLPLPERPWVPSRLHHQRFSRLLYF